jgi:hypothetical protein
VRVSFDSNTWEKIFDPTDRECAPLRAALSDRRLEGFISEAAFRIEAIRKRDRALYFAQPHMDSRFHGVVMRDGRPYGHMSFGPDDARHPGLPVEQAGKLQRALAAGVRLMHAASWVGLPAPSELHDPTIFVSEASEAARARAQRELDVSPLVDARGVGKAAFDAAGGWTAALADEKKLPKACAEWADGELVIAHIAYRNDVLCTHDRARAGGRSIFDRTNRLWLSTEYGVVFKTINELIAEIAK